jgi:hypothetical protein
MKRTLHSIRGPTEGPRNIPLVRIAVGLILFTPGILKYIDPKLGSRVIGDTRIVGGVVSNRGQRS